MDEVIRVLHVDDDPEICEVTSSYLERTDDRFEVVTAVCVSEGLDVLDSERIDCVVSDYQMPKRDGFDFLDTVRHRDADLPFILYTGKGSEEIASEAISAGVTDYLQKETGGTQYELLANRIVNAVDQYRAKRRRAKADDQGNHPDDDPGRAELEEKVEFYETILNTVPDAVYALDEDMHYLFVNEGMAELTGYPQEEIIGSHKSMVNTDESVKSGQVKRMELAEDHRDGVKIAIHPHVTADGEEIPTEVRFSMLPAEEGDFNGTAGVVRDVTQRLERQRELERQNRRLDEFASVVSHDLRNPINVAEGRIAFAREDCECDGTTDHLSKAQGALERMNAIIDDVLSFARQGETVTEYERVDLRTVAQDAWEAVGDQDGTIVVDDDATIPANTVRLQRLFENLLRNAREHGHAAVTVRVGTVHDGFYVEDDGPGIPPDEREEVFEPGFTTAREGTGFGLAIVKSIVESHGWTVEVTDAKDGGARFEVTGLDRP